MATAEEAEPSRAGGTDHEYSCIHEPVCPRTVVPFKQRLFDLLKNHRGVIVVTPDQN